MTCPRNSLGQPACFITAHPARPQHKFCVTCHQQFPVATRPTKTSPNPNLMYWAIAILTVVVVTKAVRVQSVSVPQPVYQFQTLQ